MINLPGLGIENALPILTSLQWPNHRTDKQANSIYPSLRVCFFIPLQSFIMHTFNLAISTHWSQLQNRLKTNLKLTFSVLMTSLHCPALTYTNRLLFQANLKRPPVFNLAATHTHTHTFKKPSAHSFTPTRSGWKLSVVSPGASNAVVLMCSTKRRKRKHGLLGYTRQAGFGDKVKQRYTMRKKPKSGVTEYCKTFTIHWFCQ